MYPWTFCIGGRFVERMFCQEGRYVEGRFVDGRFVEGRLVLVPRKQSSSGQDNTRIFHAMRKQSSSGQDNTRIFRVKA